MPRKKQSEDGPALFGKAKAAAKRKEKMVCYVCGNPGHAARACPSLAAPPEQPEPADEPLDEPPSRSRQRADKKERRRRQKEPPPVPHAPGCQTIDTVCHLHRLLAEADCGTLEEAIRPQLGLAGAVWAVAGPEALHREGEQFECWRRLATASGGPAELWLMVGLSAEHAEWWPRVRGTVRRLAEQLPEAVALGPCGLEPEADPVEQQLQRQALRGQLELAAELELPIAVHMPPGSQEEAVPMMSELLPPDAPVLLLGFEGSDAALLELLDQFGNLCVGFSATVTYRKAKRVHQLAYECPLDRLCLSSHSPDLLPAEHGGGRAGVNHPGLLGCTAESIAGIKRIGLDQVLQAAHANTLRLFGLTAGAAGGAQSFRLVPEQCRPELETQAAELRVTGSSATVAARKAWRCHKALVTVALECAVDGEVILVDLEGWDVFKRYWSDHLANK